MTQLNPASIMYIVSDTADVSLELLQGIGRFKHIARARFAVYYIMRTQGFSYPVIGRCINRDHTTVLYGFKKARELVYTNSEFNLLITTIQRKIHLAGEEINNPMQWFVFTDGKGVATVVQADDIVEAEKMYRRDNGAANYSFTPADMVLRKSGVKTLTWQRAS